MRGKNGPVPLYFLIIKLFFFCPSHSLCLKAKREKLASVYSTYKFPGGGKSNKTKGEEKEGVGSISFGLGPA